MSDKSPLFYQGNKSSSGTGTLHTYLDDWLIWSSLLQVCQTSVCLVLDMILRLGFMSNSVKTQVGASSDFHIQGWSSIWRRDLFHDVSSTSHGGAHHHGVLAPRCTGTSRIFGCTELAFQTIQETTLVAFVPSLGWSQLEHSSVPGFLVCSPNSWVSVGHVYAPVMPFTHQSAPLHTHTHTHTVQFQTFLQTNPILWLRIRFLGKSPNPHPPPTTPHSFLVCRTNNQQYGKMLTTAHLASEPRAMKKGRPLFNPGRSEMYLRGKSVRSWCDGSSDRSFMRWTH